MSKTVAVIDGNSLMHRAYHAVPPTMNAPDGTPTNACFGFVAMLLKFVEMAHPDAIVCAFDAGRPKWRMEAIEQYKAQRPPMDDALKVQFPLMEGLLEAMSIPVVRVAGWEGDDILGTVSARDEALGYRTLLVSGDKDVYQLVSELTHVVTTKKGITDVAIYGPDEVFERYGVTPAQFPDFLGLKGDASDNIPGVPGVGDKTAAKLLSAYGNLEGIYEHTGELKGKQKEKIETNRDQAFASRKVATISRNVDFELDLEDAAFPSFDVARVTAAFKSVRFNAHLTHVLNLVGEKAPAERAALSWEPVLHGAAAHAAVKGAIAEGERVGIAFVEPEQASLFDTGAFAAFSTSKGTAAFGGDEALSVLAQVVAQGRFAALDAKEMLYRVYPADTAQEARITDEELFAAEIFDVGLAGYVMNSSVSDYTLESLADEYLGGALPEVKTDEERACVLAAAACALEEPLSRALEDDGSMRTYAEIDLPLVPVLTAMERTGAAIDVAHLDEIGERTQGDVDALRARIIELAGEEFNVDSPKQLGHILFEVLGLPPKKKTQRGYSTDAKVLKELAEVHELPALVLRYRELAKIKSTYIDALPRMRAEDGRVHTSFNEMVTTTGRLSSSDPNLQNIPVRTDFGRQIRTCFVPLGEGEVFVSADYSQIELRLLAHLSGDEHLIASFNSGEDFHASTASRVFGVPMDDVTPQMRSRAKAVNFGIVYGQQAYGLSQSLHIPFYEAKEMIDRYFEVHPGVRTYLDDVVAQAHKDGYAITLFGRRRYIPELKAKNAAQRGFGERTAMNHPMQGTAADIIKLAMRQVQDELVARDLGTRLMLQVHDELDLSVPESEVEEVSDLLTSVMESVVELSVPLLVDVSAGANWAEAH